MTKDSTVIISSLTEFFQKRVSKAMKRQGISTSQETEYYVVNLLDHFSKAERLHGPEQGEQEALILTLGKALQSNRDEAIPLYRRIGDESLYMSGFFSQRLKRQHLSPRYYQDLGATAYETLSSLMKGKRDKVFADIFGELAEKFDHLVEVLIAIGEQHTFSASKDPEDLLQRWEKTPSKEASRSLLEEGLLPLWHFGPGEGDPQSN